MLLIMNMKFAKMFCLKFLNRIQSKNQNIGSYKINKISSYDNKKYILKDGYSELSHFRKSIR